MSFLQLTEPETSLLFKNVRVLNDKNQLICFCGEPMIFKDRKNQRVGCSKNRCKLVLDQYALVKWVSSGALENSPSMKLPICRVCEACCLYAPLKSLEKSDGKLRPLFKCDCKKGKMMGTYYSEEDYPQSYKIFDFSKLPFDDRERITGSSAGPVKFNINDLQDA